MKIIKKQHLNISNKGVTTMQSLQIKYDETNNIDYVEKNIDMDKIIKMAKESSARIKKDKDKRLKKAIKEHDSYYISRELQNVSTYELIKMILRKL
jgi:hypothetical protein